MKIEFRGKLTKVMQPREFGDKRLIEFIVTIEGYTNQFGEKKGKDNNLILQNWEDVSKPTLIHNITNKLNQHVVVKAYLNGIITTRQDGREFCNNHLRLDNLQLA